MMDDANRSRPIPKPRRNVQIQVSNDRSTKYENVTINTVNIFDTKGEPKDNIPFDVTDNVPGVYKKLMDDLNCVDENNFDKSRPVPAPRRPTPSESVHLNNSNSSKESSTKNTSRHTESNNLKNYVKNETSKETNKSKSTFHCPPPPPYVETVEREPVLSRNDNLRKSFTPSNSTGSTHSSNEHIPKYKNESPGNSYLSEDDESYDSNTSDLLKSLGATSKQLTASISERISVKTKGAKHKMDKSLKQSREKLGSWGHDTSEQLKNVKSKISSGVSNFSLGRERKSMDSLESEQPSIDEEMLKQISFNSPLNNSGSKQTENEMCYETPKKSKRVVQSSPKSDLRSQYASFNSSPISLTDSDTSLSFSSSQLVFERNDRTSRSFYSEMDKSKNQNNLSDSNNKLYKNKSESNIFKLSTTLEEKYVDSESSSNESFPCPKIPAPVLNREELYGKIRTNDEKKSPARPPRSKKSYENVEMRTAGSSSTRATVDSRDIFSRNLDDINLKSYPAIFSRQVNKIFPEGNTNRSDSWKFYDVTNQERENNSSPEPVYANAEPVYGKLFEMDSNNDKCLLQSPSRNSSKFIAPNMHKHDDDFDCFPTTSSSAFDQPFSTQYKRLTLERDILKEFDPLMNRSANNPATDNNNLLLLEDLLNVDNYGKTKETTDANSLNSFDSMDDLRSEAPTDELSTAPLPPERIDSLNIELDEQPKPKETTNSRKPSHENNDMMIIHQNLNLRSDSMENIVDERIVEQYLSQTDDTAFVDQLGDPSHPLASRSNWFVDGSEENYLKQQQNNTLNCNDKNSVDKLVKTVPKLNLADDNELPPPSYFEAMGKPQQPTTSNKPKIVPNVPNSSPPSSPLTPNKNSSVKTMFSSVLNLGRKPSMRNPLTRTAIQMVPKAPLSQRYIHHEGHLIRFPTRVVEDILKELSPRNAELREKRFTAYLDPQHKTIKEQFLLEYILTIQCVDNQKISNTPDMHCFELTVGLPKNHTAHLQTSSNPNMIISSTNSGNVKTTRVCHVYGVAKRSERNLWMQKMIESMTDVFPQKFTCEYTRAGWCYLKKSISSAWSGAWILLSGRKFLFNTSSSNSLNEMDLRKARCIVLKEHDESINNLHVEEGPLLMIDCPPFSLYMVMNCPRETKVWRHIIKESAHNNGTSLKRQQLTKDNIPVIVDKCINFIYANGSMSEGIYRKAGSENAIDRILTAFRANAFNVQLVRNEYTEHDVSNSLKRFMRELPERLLEKYASAFLEVSKIRSVQDKIGSYKALLENLSAIEYATLRKLVGHLNFIQSQKHVNKMGVSNLSLIWGIALLRKNKDDAITFHEQDAKVVADLITLYKNLFPISADEIAKEQIMLSVLQKYHAAAENLSDSVKQSGDLKIWITIDPNPDNKTEEKRQINVSLTPTKTVYDVCKELAGHMKLEPHKVTLKEVILKDDLFRPMHYTERVLDTVLKWTYWQDADRKDNYLKVVPTRFLDFIDRTIKTLGTVIQNSDLKFADNKTKSLKQFTLELNDDRIVVLKKEKQTIVKVKEIFLSDVTPYIGHEKKRDLPVRWSITLMENKFKKRTRDTPFIGHVLGGTNSNDQYVWYSFIMYSLHKRDILPGPEMVLT